MKYADIKTQVTLSDGREYQAELGTVESTHLGWEDHGVFTANLNFNFGGSGQGIGHMALDTCKYSREERDAMDIDEAVKKGSERIGTAGGMQFIIELVNVLGVGSWEGMKGKRIWVLREERDGYIKGLVNPDNKSKYLIFEDVWQ